MKKILFNIYSGELPNQLSGGPNNIIYKIINSSNYEEFKFSYLSSDIFLENISKENLINSKDNLSIKKKIAAYFSKKISIYRKIFGSDVYLHYYFLKKDSYYKKFRQKQNAYDFIHSQDSISLSFVADENTNSKKIMSIHSKGPFSDEIRNMPKSKKFRASLEKKLKTIERKNIELADLITFPSWSARKYFENSIKVNLPDEKVKIIYNGIDLNQIQEINKDDILDKYGIKKTQGTLLLLNIAAHSREKNIDILLRVVSELKHTCNQQVLLINIGAESNLTKLLKSLTKSLDIEKNVLFIGQVENNDVIRFLKATDIFIMTSEKVIFDLVVIEALACGACCVVTDEGGNREIIKDGENGYLINIKNVDEIANKIMSLDKNKVRSEARETAKQFSIDKMANEYFQIYGKLLDEI